ncbi:MAG: diadenosine tetraphosphatase [Planctomycetaceae bacterium]|nr:diadenosine tetraphosphatase [Planctomycetaceae bacterium]
MYDIIGDIHGHAHPLNALLQTLGYTNHNGVYSHPENRQVIFLGDFIDRGPNILETLVIAKSMVDAGTALVVMGNHEFNALAYHTKHPTDDRYLRPHSEKNQKQHQATLDALNDSQLADYLTWFTTLPTHLDLGNLRIVHACWDQAQLDHITHKFAGHIGFDVSLLMEASNPGDPLFHAIETVLKGPEVSLPQGYSYQDKEGNVRYRIRIKWYEPFNGQTIAQYMMPPTTPPDPNLNRPLVLPSHAKPQGYPATDPPVFVGHYWMPSKSPAPLTPNVTCVDYSVAKQGLLVAYRYNGESILDATNYVAVPAQA